LSAWVRRDGYEPTREAAMAAFAKSSRRGEKGYTGVEETVHVYHRACLPDPVGFITFLGGAFGLLMLLFEEVSKTERVQFRYYAMVVGLMAGGLAMIGIGQGLRLLLLILGKA
jgi:hypothetical protein